MSGRESVTILPNALTASPAAPHTRHGAHSWRIGAFPRRRVDQKGLNARLGLQDLFAGTTCSVLSVANAETLNIVDSSNVCKKFTPTDDEHEHLEPFMNWLVGYRDAVAALTGLDKRLNEVPRDISVLGAWVLSGCHANPDRSIGEVASGVFEMFINRKPGPRLKLAAPRR